jgi:asparagine synthase (glutamine-hydrolysing)
MLDHEFVGWVASLPINLKMRTGSRKFILKKLGERLGIPSALLHRRKQGFQLPLVDWMRDSMKDQFLRVLLEPRTLQRGYFKPEAVRSMVDEHTRGRRNRSGILWRMLVLELWHRNFMEARLTGYSAKSALSSSALHPGTSPAAQSTGIPH